MQTIGIDAGGTLIKMAYEEKGKLHVKRFPAANVGDLARFLNMMAPDAVLHITGGKQQLVKERVEHRIVLIDEFEATIDGTKILLDLTKDNTKPPYLVVNIGTGTSIFHVTDENFERVTGTGLGGGTFMGLGSIIAGTADYQQLVDLAEKGDRSQADFLVSDIYGQDPSPLASDLTAANFGKAHINDDAKIEDNLHALVQMIGENILLLAGSAAQQKKTNSIIFIGGALEGNQPLQTVLAGFEELMGYKAVFPDMATYAGAVGALYH